MISFNLKQILVLTLFFGLTAQAQIVVSSSEAQFKTQNIEISERKTIEAFVSAHFCNQNAWDLFKKCAKSKRFIIPETIFGLFALISGGKGLFANFVKAIFITGFICGGSMLATSKCSSLFGNPDYDESGDFGYGMLFFLGLTQGFMDKKLGKDTLKFCQKYGIKTEIPSIADLINKAIEAHKKLESENPRDKVLRKDNINIELGKNLREEIAKLKSSKTALENDPCLV